MPAAPAPAASRLACPDGSAFDVACVGLLSDPLVQLSEPSIALHPSRAGVIAVGVHAIGATALVPAGQLVQGRVYVTEDDGASWRASPLPLPSDAPVGAYYSDPAIAFDAEGRLHASGMVLGDGERDIFATHSEDLGQTWAPAARLATGLPRVDRNWETVLPDGRVFVSWQTVADSSWVSWSLDAGKTWTRLESGPENCYTASPVAQVGDALWLGCYLKDDAVHLHELDLETRTTRPVARLDGMGCIAPRILPAPDGSVVVTCYGSLATRSSDGGATWSPPVYLPDLVTVEDGWGPVQTYWSALDPTGALHVILSPFHRPGADAHVTGNEHRVAHAALDPATWSVLAQTRLTPTGPEVASRPPASLPPSLGDDWWGIEFAGDEGRLVWMRGGAVEWARLVPATG